MGCKHVYIERREGTFRLGRRSRDRGLGRVCEFVKKVKGFDKGEEMS